MRFYYVLRNIKTGEKKDIVTDKFIGDINEKLGIYIIEDFAEEPHPRYQDEPDDYVEVEFRGEGSYCQEI